MRLIAMIMALIAAVTGCLSAQGIVSNGTTSVTGEDSIAVVFYNLDSLGQNVGGLDSLRALVRNPSGDSIFAEVVAGVSGRVSISANGGDTSYVWRALVADIDGSGGSGVYSIALTAKSDRTGAWLRTPTTAYFQLVSRRLDAIGDTVGQAAEYSLKALDSLADVLDQLGPAVDSENIAGWVWNTPQANHTIAGTFGRHLDADISGLGVGSGLYSFAIVVIDSTNDQPLPYASVAIRNLLQSALIAVGATDGDGRVTFNLNAGSFAVIARAQGYIFGGCDTIVVEGSAVDTVYGGRFDPGLPSLPLLCRVYGFLYDVNGLPVAGATVSVGLPSGMSRSVPLLISPFSVTTTTDNNGYFFVDLIPSQLLTPDGTLYEITISTSGGTVMRRRIEVPSQPTWPLTW